MKKTTPEKHRTPNYRQVHHSQKNWGTIRNCWLHFVWWTWEPAPLRPDRKDFAT